MKKLLPLLLLAAIVAQARIITEKDIAHAVADGKDLEQTGSMT